MIAERAAAAVEQMLTSDGQWLVSARAQLVAMRASPDAPVRAAAITWLAAFGAWHEGNKDEALALFAQGVDAWLAVNEVALAATKQSATHPGTLASLEKLGHMCRAARNAARSA